jgi:antitoxin Phd
MKVKHNNTVTESEAYEDFSRVAKLAEKRGRVIILRDNRPKLVVIDLDIEPQIEMTEDEQCEFVANRILREHRGAFEELAKW